MRKFPFLKAILLLLTTTTMLAQSVDLDRALKKEVKSEKIITDPKVKIGKLSNGLSYYIRNNGKPADKVELRLVVNAGSVLEDDEQQGIAHFMEHMNFNGTKHFKKNELVDYLQSIGVKFGADLNAYTSFDETVFILPIPSKDEKKLEKGFQILEDWAFNSLLTDEEIDKERGVVLEEYRLGLGAGKRMMGKYLPKLMYHSKYAKRLPIGKKDILEHFNHKIIRRYKDDWYRPDLMAVIAVGDVDVNKLEALIKAHFSKYKAVKNPRKREEFKVPNHKQTFVSVVTDKEATFNQVRIYYKDYKDAKPIVTVSDYRKFMIRDLFDQLINNRLKELQNSEKPPFVFGVSYYGGTFSRNKNAYQSFAITSPTGQMYALKTLLEENERVKRFGFKMGEFKRAKKEILANLDKTYKNRLKTESKNYVSKYIANFLEKSPIPGIEWKYDFYKKQLPDVTLNEVNKLINGFIHNDNRVIILTGIEKAGIPKITEQQVKNLLVNVQKEDLKPYNDKDLGNTLMTQIPKGGKIISETKDNKLGTTILKLSNGIKVIYKKTDFKDNEVLMEAFSYGGTSLYNTKLLKKTAVANSGLAEAGVNGFNKNDLNKILTGKIARVRPFIFSNSQGMSGSATPKDLETLFQLTYLYFTSLNKDKSAYNSFVAKQKAFLGNFLSNPNFYFQIKFNKYLNQENPRYLGFPTAEDYDKADYDLAYNKYKELFANAGDFNFYFVGNINETKLKSLIKTYLAGLPATDVKRQFKDYGFRPLSGSHTKIIKKGTEPKSNVLIKFSGQTKYNAKDAYLLKTLGEILTIKLVEVLREKESGVYGIGARGSMSKIPYGFYNFTISFPCGPNNVEKLKTDALAELQKIMDNGPKAKDIEKVKKAQLLSYKENLKKNKFWIDALKDDDYNKKNQSEIIKRDNIIKSFTADDIKNVANKYLKKGYILGILYPENYK